MIKNNNTKGIICILLAAAGFSLMTFFVREAGAVPTMQKAFFRNAFALVIAVVTLISKGEKFSVKKDCRVDVFFRCLFGTTGLVCNFYAIDRLLLADANMLNKLSPFFAILMSIPLLKEKPTRFDISATVIAFIGALFIIRPTGSNLALAPAIAGFYGGFGAGTAYVFVRRATGKGERTPIIVICFSAFSCLFTLPSIIFNYVPMNGRQWLMLGLGGVAAALGQFSITTAYKYAPAKNISVFDYTQVIFAALLGLVFLGELPTVYSIVGYVIIIGVAVIRWRRAVRMPD
ncbi:MAG: DMT family transporter [Lachnospiraceae bacterium]|nr:DMT family transporter [Lachnospiraceae bacterium]